MSTLPLIHHGTKPMSPGIFLGVGTKEYSTVIFLSTEEFNATEEDTLFSCSDGPSPQSFPLENNSKKMKVA
jgi:hypothetical protein